MFIACGQPVKTGVKRLPTPGLLRSAQHASVVGEHDHAWVGAPRGSMSIRHPAPRTIRRILARPIPREPFTATVPSPESALVLSAAAAGDHPIAELHSTRGERRATGSVSGRILTWVGGSHDHNSRLPGERRDCDDEAKAAKGGGE
jgi:hypothetical protein